MTRADRPDYAREVRNALTDPAKLAVGLGLAKGMLRHGAGVSVCCPVHAERRPSCSITLGPDGTARFRCFGCDASGDALTLIAAVRGLSLRSADDFRQVLAEGAAIAGHLTLEAEILDGQRRADRAPIARPEPVPEAPYPDAGEVAELWRLAGAVTGDREVSGYLVRRRLDPELVAARQLARVLPADGLPEWARYGSRTWNETGHRMICRVFDAVARVQSVRACRVIDGDTPKRLPPKGRRATGLVLANRAAFGMLRGRTCERVLVAEGEPDWLTLATINDEAIAVLGITSGSWTDELAARIPEGSDVVIYTDRDEQGERYAAKIVASLGEKCNTWRAVA
jgi:hypothetical protein